MIKHEVVVVGAGPAGLSAAIETAKAGADTLLIDENAKAGGQLFKQIHKFFGSERHRAGVRGIDIGRELLEEAESSDVEIWLDTVVWGLFEDHRLGILRDGRSQEIQAEKIILSTGAMENGLSFEGWTLPGVITAGSAQTMVNAHRVLPGRTVLMVGAGNVGLIVAYQLMQAGAEVLAVIETLPHIGGYGVHASKIRRAGVPIFTSYTILRAVGDKEVEGAVIAKVDDQMEPIPGSEQSLDVDTICLAVGLTPLAELALMAGCEFTYLWEFGGHVPAHTGCMRTTVPGLYVAGDVTGIEEANTAMEEGRLAGICAAADLGYLSQEEAKKRAREAWHRLGELRQGGDGERNQAKTRQLRTFGARGNLEVSGFAASTTKVAERSLTRDSVHGTGVPSETELESSPGYPSSERLQEGAVAVVECVEHIPCNPCETACPHGALRVGIPITNLPALDETACIGCGLCIAACPGLAIFVVDATHSETEALVSMPYEYRPLPELGDVVPAVDRYGETVVEGKVINVQNPPAFDHTPVVTIAVPKEYAMTVRGIARDRSC